MNATTALLALLSPVQLRNPLIALHTRCGLLIGALFSKPGADRGCRSNASFVLGDECDGCVGVLNYS